MRGIAVGHTANGNNLNDGDQLTTETFSLTIETWGVFMTCTAKSLRKLAVFITTLLALLYSGPIKANPSVSFAQCPLEVEFTCVTAIEDLMIGGAKYDMGIAVGTLSTLLADSSDQFLSWGNWDFAGAAGVAVSNAINSSVGLTDETGKFFDQTALGDGNQLLIPVEYDDYYTHDMSRFNGACPTFTSTGVLPYGCLLFSLYDVSAFAVFTPVISVPEPAAFVLILSGFAIVAMRGAGRSHAANARRTAMTAG